MNNARQLLALVLTVLLTHPTAVLAQDPAAPVIKEEKARIADNQKSQRRVNDIHQDTTDIVTEYQNKLKIVDGLRVYNTLLERQLRAQDREIETLRSSIANATVIERQMVPLMMRMLDGLEDFIRLDVPFLMQEREERVTKLRALMERADLTVAEKTRRVFEAYQIENDYGRTMEAYKGKLDLGDRSFDVDYLRIGRIALLYRSIGNDRFGYWDVKGRDWIETDENQFKRNVDKGLRIARTEMAPELFTVPVPPAGETPQ
ncbi:MAG: DUF3450 domain-containing protein [Halioglobus sp.]|nr:DUF3450 domain-containing protein [Halioglobus sp.]